MNEKFKQLIIEVCIAYTPMAGEVDWRQNDFFKNRAADCIIPQDKTVNPFALVGTLSKQFGGKKVLLLIPGQQFDIYGTRHGRGGGWYDRFLAAAPIDWLRVGIARQEQFSTGVLERNSWDQPVDWVIVQNGAFWVAHETHARQ